MPQATTKTYQLFRETLLNATSEENRKILLQLSYPETMVEVEKSINLKDVLMALENKIRDYKRRKVVFNDSNYFEIIRLLWILNKPAHLQSEETLLAIINLLK